MKPPNQLYTPRGKNILESATGARLLLAKQDRKSICSSTEDSGGFVELKCLWRPEPAQQPARCKVVKICLRGECKNIQLTPSMGESVCSVVWVDLDRNIPVTSRLYDILLFLPPEFATLLEVGLPVTLTLEQDGS